MNKNKYFFFLFVSDGMFVAADLKIVAECQFEATSMAV
jgi:hypothetical protein